MKKIMFNDKYGLTQAVLDGRKTMTRREIKSNPATSIYLNTLRDIDVFNGYFFYKKHAHYQVGEVVAIAQSYNDCVAQASESFGLRKNLEKGLKDKAGWNNKMFTKAELMPHHIRITNIRVERLQDISNEDCLREGIIKHPTVNGYCYEQEGLRMELETKPRHSFSRLIDKVSGKGTWESNPWVFVYEFELVN